MELSSIVAVQVAIVFILIAVGFTLKKCRLIDENGSKQLTNILLMIVTPCVLINSYQREFIAEYAVKLLAAAGFAVLIHIVMIIAATLLCRPEKTNHYRINIFSAVYSNCGFMAIPLLTAVLGTDGVFYGAAYLAIFNICYWTHGVLLYSGDRKSLSLKKAFLNPGVIGTFLSLLLFFLQIRLPKIVLSPVEYLAGLNTPLAMIVLGAYLADIDLRKTLKKPSIYFVSLLRLIVFPIIAVFLAKLMRLDETVATSVLISAACPTATVTTLFAAKFGLDAGYASEIVSFTTLLSIVTIPLVMFLV